MEVKISLQEDLTDLQNDEAKTIFKVNRCDLLWCNVSEKYPVLWKEAMLLVLSFPTSCLVEKGFSAVSELLSKKHSRLSITERGDLHLYLTKLSPNVKEIASHHQPQPSHGRYIYLSIYLYVDGGTFPTFPA